MHNDTATRACSLRLSNSSMRTKSVLALLFKNQVGTVLTVGIAMAAMQLWSCSQLEAGTELRSCWNVGLAPVIAR